MTDPGRMFDDPAHDRIAKLKAAGMVSGYGDAEMTGKAMAAGGESLAARVEAVIRRHAAADLLVRALGDMETGLRNDFAVMAEAQEIAADALALVDRIRRRYAPEGNG